MRLGCGVSLQFSLCFYCVMCLLPVCLQVSCSVSLSLAFFCMLLSYVSRNSLSSGHAHIAGPTLGSVHCYWVVATTVPHTPT